VRVHHERLYGPKTARDISIRNTPTYTSLSPGCMPDEIAGEEDLRMMLDSYDGSTATVDSAICEVIAVLKEEGVYDDSVIIVSADHSEAVGQFGMCFEHGVAVDGVTRVPLIVRWPGLTNGGGRSEAFLYQYDFMATLADLLGFRTPELWDARSFAPALRGAPFQDRP
jgi:arylsulfatase A-like enzyme